MMNVTNEDFELDLNFGLDPHVLPQFDLLVADGRITREYADQVISARREAGLPMTPDELQPRPEPLVEALVWVKELGGPEIRASSQREGSVSIQDLEWRWWTYSTGNTDLTTHFHKNGEHQGWIRLHAGSSNSCVHWTHHKILDRKPGEQQGNDDILSVKAEGKASDIYAAMADALAWEFTQVSVAGHTWYQTSNKSWTVAVWDRSVMSVRMVDEFTLSTGRAVSWLWESGPTRLNEFFDSLDIPHLRGFAATHEEAMTEASSVFSKVLAAAHQLVGDVDAFTAGKAAGRAELKAEICRLD